MSQREPIKLKLDQVFPEISAPIADWRTFSPDSLVVAFAPDLVFEFSRTVTKREGKYVTWVGRNDELPGASLVGVATAKGYDAVIVLPGSSHYSLHVRGDDVVMLETSPGEEGCGVAPVQLPRVPQGSPGAIVHVATATGGGVAPELLAATAPRTVDVLVAYTADTRAKAEAVSPDPVGYIDGQAKALIETGNVTLAQSGVTEFAWRHLGVVEAPSYERTGKTSDDLSAMRGEGALASWVATQRYERGADQILMFIGTSSDFAGRAYAPKQRAVAATSAVSVLLWGASSRSFAHELAHNFGCHHDRGHANVVNFGEDAEPAPDNDGFWCYGQLWANPKPPGYTGNLGTSGTIMSYCDWTLPYFSNPAITVHVFGGRFGWSWNPDLGAHQLGRAAIDPKAAYNALVLEEQAVAMSGLAEEILQPAIVTQPASASVPRGQYANLSVTASGGGLAYQWRRAGVAIEGATSANYSRLVADADAGSYSVVVTNFAGTATSNDAVINVTAPLPAPGSGSGGGGGGGGGGAPSYVFVAALILTAALRFKLRTRSSG